MKFLSCVLSLIVAFASPLIYAYQSDSGLSPESQDEFRRVFGCSDCGPAAVDLSYFAAEVVDSASLKSIDANLLKGTVYCRAYQIVAGNEVPVQPKAGQSSIAHCIAADENGPVIVSKAYSFVSIDFPSAEGPSLGGLGYPSIGPKSEPALMSRLQANCSGTKLDSLSCIYSSAKYKVVSFKGEAVINGKQVTPIACANEVLDPNSARPFDTNENCAVKDGITWGNLLVPVNGSPFSYVDIVISPTLVVRLYKQFGMNVQFQFAHSFLQGPASLDTFKLDPSVMHEFKMDSLQ